MNNGLLINHYIEKRSWIIQSWQNQSKTEYWTVLIPDSIHIFKIREILDRENEESTLLKTYLTNEGSWLPIVVSSSMKDAMAKLSQRLVNYEYDWSWEIDVHECCNKLAGLEYGADWKAAVLNKEPVLYKRAAVAENQYYTDYKEYLYG